MKLVGGEPGRRTEKRARAALSFVLGIGACGGRTREPADVPAPAPAQASTGAPNVHDECGFVGVVVARQTIDVASRVGGKLVALPIPLGGHVRAGEPLAELDDPELELAVRAAAASVSAARSRVERVESDRANARRVSAQTLALGELASGDEREEARHALAQTKADHVGASGQLAAQRVDLLRKQQQLEALRIRADVDGTIALHYRAAGELLRPGDPVVRLVSDEVLVRVAVPEREVGRLHVGTRLRFVAAGDATELIAVVDHIGPEVDAAGYVLVEARPRDPAPRPGTSGRAWIDRDAGAP